MRTSADASPKLLPFAINASIKARAALVSRSTVTPLASKFLRAAANRASFGGDWSFSMTMRRSATARSSEWTLARASAP